MNILRFSVAVLMIVLGGCQRLDAMSGRPQLDPNRLVPPDAAYLIQNIQPGTDQNTPAACTAALSWENTVSADAKGNPVGIINSQPQQPEDVYKMYRDKCIYIYLDAIDLSYMKFKADVLALVGDANSGVDISVLALTGASTAVGSKTAKTILSGIATFLGGVKDKITADVLYNASIVALLQTMDADRNATEAIILQRMQKGYSTTAAGSGDAPTPAKATGPTVKSGTISKNLTIVVPATPTAPASTMTVKSVRTIPAPAPANNNTPAKATTPLYTLYEAANDLVAYYAAGTYSHAVVSMQERTGAHATNCKAAATNLKTTGTKTGTGGTADGDTSSVGTTTPASSTAAGQPNAC